MYRHILIAIDGSDCSLIAAEQGLSLAHAVGATVTAITVTPTWKAVGLSELALGHTEEEYEASAKAYGDKCLERVQERAAGTGIACEVIQVMHAHPYEAIVDAADTRACDLIVVGSHGRRGVARLLLGSEASKVLARSKVSVLVCRGRNP
jgi:nucleotide-binding universal stress UspA family protein